MSRERGEREQPNEVRRAAWLWPMVGALIAWILHRRGVTFAPCAASLAAGIAVGIAARIAPRVVRPLHSAWMTFARAIRFVTTPFVLTLVYVLVFVPARGLLALFRRDPLDRGFDRAAPSYWIARPRRSVTRDEFERLV